MTDVTVDDLDQSEPAGAALARQARLGEAVRGIRARARGVPAEKWLQVGGAIMVPFGAALVLLGWWGAAHTTRLWIQIPYVVSGGLLGLGLMFTGGFFYFAHWVTHLVQDSRAQAREAMQVARETQATLERIETLLDAQAGGRRTPVRARARP